MSGWEQLGVAIRYVKHGLPVEKLIKFVVCERIKSKDLCQALLETLQTLAGSQTLQSLGI